MKKIIVFFFSISVFAQDYGNNAEALEICTTLQSNSFSSDLDADNALDRILSVVGLSKNFVLSPCSNINNAVAVSYKGVRYILYDPEFMSILSSNTSNWTNLFILAHEVGHHVNGHSLDLVLYAGDIVDVPELEKKRKQELEADEFAGFVLAKLGASLAQTTSSVSMLSNEDDKYSTHPKRDKRLSSIQKGWNSGFDNKDRVVKKERIVRTPKQGKFEKWFFKVNYPKQEKINEIKDITNPFIRHKLLGEITKAGYPEKTKTAWSFGLITENNSNIFNNEKINIKTGNYTPINHYPCTKKNLLDLNSLIETNLRTSQKYSTPKTPKLEFTDGQFYLSNFSDLDYWWFDTLSPFNNTYNQKYHVVYFQYVIDNDFSGIFELKISEAIDLMISRIENGKEVIRLKKEMFENHRFAIAFDRFSMRQETKKDIAMLEKYASKDIDFGINYHSPRAFTEKLKSGNILYLKLLGVSIYKDYCEKTFYSFYDISNTYEFDLRGSSRALSF